MTKLTAWYASATETEQNGRIPTLDGARTLFVGLVAAYHLWQQSWLTPSGTVFGTYVSLDPWLRCGYIWVDAMLLLSGFLLYLPYAQSRAAGKPFPKILRFYKHRLLRIVPSYYLCVLLVLLFSALPGGSYNNADGTLNLWNMGRDLLAHATFTHTLFSFSYTSTPLNGALWTLGVEMQFYLLFPFIARLFSKKPAVTYCGMCLVSVLFSIWAQRQGDTTMLVNQLPAQLCAYGNGMLCAGAYVSLKGKFKQDGFTRAFFTAVLCVCAFAIARMVSVQAGSNGYDNIRAGQMNRRWFFTLIVGAGMVSLLFSMGGIKLFFGNRVTRFLSAVSFQFYMWHTVIAQLLKKWNIPVSAYETPWVNGDRGWQILYVLLCVVLTLTLSALLTYCFEQPLARLSRRREDTKKR